MVASAVGGYERCSCPKLQELRTGLFRPPHCLLDQWHLWNLCESQLENINGETSTSLQAEDTCQNDEPANTFPIYGGPPRKKRKRTETDEILAAATSALKSLGSRQAQQSSLYSSIGQVVTHTLESLNGEQQQKCISEIFSLLAKYTAPTTGPSEA
ncbi:hypothetical protein AVEN_38655-1 [Araneus ventricosus]|uniref:Uncharacterized protein n=1 Tax=Araneus ventricosus TaxID=182803 RepID=A0A4Y2T6K1_ARAVE|nr:hypothetical protein AVEN_38655-1 [Araneus ventricosus]